MITDEPISVLTNSAVLGGRVFGEGGKDVIEYGVVWSENFPPTINDNKVVEGMRLGSFSKRYSGFKPNTTYYYSTYGINQEGIGYGTTYNFVTNAKPPCSHPIDNRIDTNNNVNGVINIDDVVYENPSGFNDGNVRFKTGTFSSTLRITLNFNEIGSDLPLTGEYITVISFDNQSIKSNREVMLSITDFGLGSLGGGKANSGKKIYVENDGFGHLSFTFCDVTVNNNYTLNGKFTYKP
jgi:hypothetical protein